MTDVTLGVAASGPGARLRPVVHGGTVRVPNAAFVDIMRHLLAEEIVLPFVTLAFVGGRWITEGAEITFFARTAILQRNVTARLALSAAPDGCLRVRIDDVRSGFLPMTWLVERFRHEVERQPGLRLNGERTVDVDIEVVLAARNVPVEWQARVRRVAVMAEELTIEFGVMRDA